jgi:hypothetical protein
MRVLRNGLILVTSIAALGADDEASFRPLPAAEYSNKLTISGLTIAADAYTTSSETKGPFGKLNPNRHGVLPVLVVMQNGSRQTLRLERMRVEYLREDGRRIEAVPAPEVRFLYGIEKPNLSGQRVPYPLPGLGKKKNPLAAEEIEGRAFSARMLPPGDSASGFFYFNTAPLRSAQLYITGISEASTGQELFFFELPLE